MVFWALLLLVSPTPSTTHLVIGVAAAAAALLVVLAATSGVRRAPAAPAAVSGPVLRGDDALPRLIDPDAAGRPRSRAPSGCPTAA